jgi:hypothetical protein
MPDKETENWFGPVQPIGDLAIPDAVKRLREIGDETGADELASAVAGAPADTYAASDVLKKVFSRFIKTTHLCGFLPATGGDTILPVASTPGEVKLKDQPLKIVLDGLHVARYPGWGRHSILFDFAVQSQTPDDTDGVFHFNAKFEADNGETVPVRNFPLFVGVTPKAAGISFGFQTVNISSSKSQGLLDFLNDDAFKTGLSLLPATPVIAQISEIAVGLTSWLAGQSSNVKVQQFRQGLDFGQHLGGGLASGTYIVAQIPLEHEAEWNWSDWRLDPTLTRLVSRTPTPTTLDFNHVMLGVRPL